MHVFFALIESAHATYYLQNILASSSLCTWHVAIAISKLCPGMTADLSTHNNVCNKARTAFGRVIEPCPANVNSQVARWD